MGNVLLELITPLNADRFLSSKELDTINFIAYSFYLTHGKNNEKRVGTLFNIIHFMKNFSHAAIRAKRGILFNYLLKMSRIEK
jgi:hypothetical protein